MFFWKLTPYMSQSPHRLWNRGNYLYPWLAEVHATVGNSVFVVYTICIYFFLMMLLPNVGLGLLIL